MAAKLRSLRSFEYEVHGKVQGVFFRRDTKREADKLGIRGWVMNTSHGTVVGKAEGTEEAMAKMKNWLSHVGSKKSKISHCDVKNEQSVSAPEFTEFKVVR